MRCSICLPSNFILSIIEQLTVVIVFFILRVPEFPHYEWPAPFVFTQNRRRRTVVCCFSFRRSLVMNSPSPHNFRGFLEIFSVGKWGGAHFVFVRRIVRDIATVGRFGGSDSLLRAVRRRSNLAVGFDCVFRMINSAVVIAWPAKPYIVVVTADGTQSI